MKTAKTIKYFDSIDYRFVHSEPWDAENKNGFKKYYHIKSDGTVCIEDFNSSGTAGHWQLQKMVQTQVDLKDLQKLYFQLMECILNSTGTLPPVADDCSAAVIIRKHGLKIQADRTVTDGTRPIGDIIADMFDQMKLL